MQKKERKRRKAVKANQSPSEIQHIGGDHEQSWNARSDIENGENEGSPSRGGVPQRYKELSIHGMKRGISIIINVDK